MVFGVAVAVAVAYSALVEKPFAWTDEDCTAAFLLIRIKPKELSSDTSQFEFLVCRTERLEPVGQVNHHFTK